MLKSKGRYIQIRRAQMAIGAEIYNRLRLQCISVRKQIFTKGWGDKRIPNMDSVLCLVLDGSAFLNVGNKSYRVKKGDFYLLPENAYSTFGCDEEEKFILRYVHFRTDLLSCSLFNWIDCSEWAVHLSDFDFKRCIEYHENLYMCSLQSPTVNRAITENCMLHNLLYIFLKQVNVKERKQEDWIGNTLQYISDNLDKDLSIENLAGRIALHPNYFIRCFTSKVGISPARYIAELRVQYAKTLLVQGTKTMQEICSAIGMSEISVFYGFFRRHTGTTPLKYKFEKESEKIK